MLIVADAFLEAHYALIAGSMIKKGIPSISALRQFPAAGGLLSYGADRRALWRQCATYLDKILKGAKPGNLPIEQPTKFELIINLTIPKLTLDLWQPLNDRNGEKMPPLAAPDPTVRDYRSGFVRYDSPSLPARLVAHRCVKPRKSKVAVLVFVRLA